MGARLVVLLTMGMLVAGCARSALAPTAPATTQPAPAARQGQLTVVATYSILGDLVQNVAGDRVTLHTLVGPGQDTHTFEASPGDSAALARAAVVFENGLAFDAWVGRLHAASGATAKRVAVTNGLPKLLRVDEDQDEDYADEEQAGDRRGEFDPHVWHDVANTRHMVTVIREALIEVDPANAATYRANADRYLAELQTLDAWIVEQVNSVPQERRKLVTTHDTFGYFAERYGFDVLGTALGAASTEASEPSAAEFARLVEDVKAAGVPVIFAENVGNDRLMQRLAQEAGARLAPELYTDALSQAGGPAATYLDLMRHNVTVITTALRA